MGKRMDAIEIVTNEHWIEVKEEMASLRINMKAEIKKKVSLGLKEIRKAICKEIRVV